MSRIRDAPASPAHTLRRGVSTAHRALNAAKGFIALTGGSKGSASKTAAADAGKAGDTKHHTLTIQEHVALIRQYVEARERAAK